MDMYQGSVKTCNTVDLTFYDAININWNKNLKETEYHSGVVAIIGPPNAGKSTLLNYFLGQKITIVSDKPQTTRNKILGIVSGNNYQIILLDTPGLHKARDIMNKEMVKRALESLNEADVVVFLDDISTLSKKLLAKRHEEYKDYFSGINVPSIMVLNKIDLVEPQKILPLTKWFADQHEFEAIVPISALNGTSTDSLLAEIVGLLPEGPQYYPDDIPTDSPERFIVAEIIREKVFRLTHEEVPYSTAVVIESFEENNEESGPVVIHATIVIERSSQKGILIGHKGEMLAKIRKWAVKDIKNLLGCPVQLRLWVKVKKNWTNNEFILKEFGLK